MYMSNDNIFRFDITVKNIIAMKIGNTIENLHDGLTDYFLWGDFIISYFFCFVDEFFIEGTTFCILHQQENMVLVFEEWVEFNNAWMIQQIVDF